MLEVIYGNISLEEAKRLACGEDHEPGSAEPWIANIVGSLVVARGARVVLETGSFMGRTSRVIAKALKALGGGRLILMEIDSERVRATQQRLRGCPSVKVDVLLGDAIHSITRLPDRLIDVAWVDDDHTKRHVERELTLLYPKMVPGGLILGHDVWGSCDLQAVFQKFGGYSLDLPRLGLAGGIGMIQVPSGPAGFYLQSTQAIHLARELIALGVRTTP